jgi:hypothetical protein
MTAATYLAMVLLGFRADGANPPNDLATIQGIWRGTGNYSHVTLIFCGDTLLGVNEAIGDHRWAIMHSNFTLDTKEHSIDIARQEGEQLGRYLLEADRLSLSLGEIDRARPKQIEPLVTEGPNTGRRRDRGAAPPFRYYLERAK